MLNSVKYNFLPSLAQISELAPAGCQKVELVLAIWSKITVEGQTAGHKMGPHHTDPVLAGLMIMSITD
jgi:hypothetical protein